MGWPWRARGGRLDVVPLYEVTENGLVRRPVAAFADLGLYERHDIQRLLRDAISALGQDVFADLIGVHRTYASAVERGRRNLTLRSVERLADRLAIEPMDLLRE